MKILVTGGAGFLGSHLVDKLVKQKHQVYCLDNFSTGRRNNISHLMTKNNFELIIHDITDPIELDVDQIYNLACPASPLQYQIDPVKTIRTNILGAINVLDLARRTGAQVLQASTSEIYGDPEVHPQPESYWGRVNPIGIRSCYDEGKRSAETLFFDYWRQYQTRIKVVRIFNTYGPNMDPADGRVVSNFIMQALHNKLITINGDGSQTRSFCYVSDLIDVIIKTMNTSDAFTGPVNIGNPKEFTVLELANKIIELTGSSSQLYYADLPQDDPKQRQPNIALLQEQLGWNPKINLIDGLIKTISYFKSNTQS
jgi:UDP-glucuronate decarboxylase